MKSEFEPHPNIDISKFKYGDLTQKIIKVFFEVYNELGHGFLESVYSKSLEFDPRKSIRANPCLSVADLLRSD
jgi:PD-(D/E)XK nuclease superfamily